MQLRIIVKKTPNQTCLSGAWFLGTVIKNNYRLCRQLGNTMILALNSQRADFFFQKGISPTDNESSSVPKSFRCFGVFLVVGFFFPSIVVWGFLSSSEKLEREIFSDDFGINKSLNDKSKIS